MATGQASDVLGHALLDHIFTDPSLTPPSTLYLALCTATPTKAQSGSSITEIGYGGYARKATTAADWNAASGDKKDNSVTLSFPQSTNGPFTAKAVALVSASSAGQLYMWAMLASPVKAAVAEAADNLIHCPGHGYSNGNKVVVDADTLPGGILRDTEYTVASATTDTFALSEVADITTTSHILIGVSKWIVVNNLSIPEFAAGQLSFTLV